MKRIVMIGGKGRVGSYLVPQLVADGYLVLNVSRGQTEPPRPDRVWQQVEQVVLDRKQDDFPQHIAALHPDAVIDMVCFKADDMLRLADALQDQVGHYLVCGSIWMHGPSETVPCPEHLSRTPTGVYGQEKLKMDDAVQQLFAQKGFPGTIVHPGHIVAEGFRPINPQGNFNPQVFSDLRRGQPLVLPNLGMETLHPVHAADVAGVFLASLRIGSVSFGQGFHAVAPAAVTLSGYARSMAAWFGQEARLRFLPFDEWAKAVPEADAAATLEHISRSPNASMDKARHLLGFVPRFAAFEAVQAAVTWLIDHGQLA